MTSENSGGGGRISNKGGEGRGSFSLTGFFVNGEGRTLETVAWVRGGKGFVLSFRSLVLTDGGIIISFKTAGLFFLSLILSCKEARSGLSLIWKPGSNEVLKLASLLVGNAKLFPGYFIVGVRFSVTAWRSLVSVSLFCALACCKKKRQICIWEQKNLNLRGTLGSTKKSA